jgi:hypothetical protein
MRPKYAAFALLPVVAVASLVVYLGVSADSEAESETPVHSVQKEPLKPFEGFQLSGLAARPLAEPAPIMLVADVTRNFPFAWPAQGNLTSYMGPGHPAGIDIGLDYGSISPITAMARGTVFFAGGSTAHDYGYYVVVDHGHGLQTLYAHLDRILVRQGEAVSQGQMLGHGGNTGKSTGKHLHFEVRQNDLFVDPLDLLPTPGQKPPAVSFDCSANALVIDRGSTARLDFTASLSEGSRFGRAEMKAVKVAGNSPAVAAKLDSDGVVIIDTAPALARDDFDDAFKLDLIVEGTGPKVETSCDIIVRTKGTAPSFYVRAADPTIYSSTQGTSTPAARAQEISRETTATPAPQPKAEDPKPGATEAAKGEDAEEAEKEAEEEPTPSATGTPATTGTPAASPTAGTPTTPVASTTPVSPKATETPTPNPPATVTPAPETPTPAPATATPTSTKPAATTTAATASPTP